MVTSAMDVRSASLPAALRSASLMSASSMMSASSSRLCALAAMVTFAMDVRSASLPAALRSASLMSASSRMSASSTRKTTATKMTRMSLMTAQVQDIITTHRVDVRDPLLRERLLGEMVGTFFLVLTVGIGVASGSDMAPVAIGLMLAVQIYTFGSVSGGFLNPAVTLAVVLAGRQKISSRIAALYMAAEFLGGIAAGVAAFAGTEKSFCFDYAAKSQSWGTGFELEMLFTMALCGIVLAAGTSNDAPNQYFGFAIGCTVVAGALACGGFDQGSFNPAVTVGMNIANYANGNATQNPSVGAWFVFTLAPFVGGALAAGVFRGTRSNEFEEETFETEELNTPLDVQASTEVKAEV